MLSITRRRVLGAAAVILVLGGTTVAAVTLLESDEQLDDATLNFSFRNDTDAGFSYRSVESGLGNGNDGVYVADVNRDRWPDVLTVGGENPVLFVNDNGSFDRARVFDTDARIQAALFVDRDGDGWEDLLLLPRHGQARYYENEGGEFDRRDVGFDRNLTVPVAASAADYDGDGSLGVFVAQYGDWAETTPEGYMAVGNVTDDNGNPNFLFRNEGGEFVHEASPGGDRWSLAVSSVDLNGDGRPDIHVSNDFNNDTVLVNRGDGDFEERILGPATDRNGMSSEVFDADHDGNPDLFVTNIYVPTSRSLLSTEDYVLLRNYYQFVLGKRAHGNTLLLNDGDGEFTDRADEFGVRKGGWGWAAVAADFDNDGRRDLFSTTQRLIRAHDPPVYTYPMLFGRTDDGFVRTNASAAGFHETNGRGAAALDYDRDGDVDLLVAQFDGPYLLYENEASGGNAVQFRVQDADGATAVGARVEVRTGDRTVTEWVNSRADYQSQDSRVVHVGLGDGERIDAVTVQWPDGTTRTFEDLDSGNLYVLRPGGIDASLPFERGPKASIRATAN